MLGPRTITAVAAVALALAGSSVNAHGTLTRPAPTFNGYGGGVASTIDVSKLPVPSGMTYHAAPDTNAAAFDTAFKKTGQSLKAFILKNQDRSGSSGPTLSAECGFSDPSGKAQELPDKLQWGTKFIHPGPCEAWCDNEIVVPYTANCWKTFPDGSMPYAKAKCAGKKRLTFYWLGVHGPPWQVYINCVPLSGASSGGGTSGATSAAAPKRGVTNAKPAVKNAKPAATTKAPNRNGKRNLKTVDA
ncbi:hypothetical protein PybrP1_010306 [[Pythium] brassicae (nom. inval.)]|nr:hypothetical protein PybrP1_010306 [[Pythium] brassicae (nom. inval.)]